VTVLARPGEDAHFVDARPSLMVRMRGADLFILNGLDLEVGWVPPLLEGCRNGAIQPGKAGYLDVSAVVRPIEVPSGVVDRALGDVHPLGNPHYTCDPIALRAVAGAIAERLGRLDPAGAKAYESGLEAWRLRLDTALFGEDLVEQVGGGKLARLCEEGELDAWLDAEGLSDRRGGWLKAMADVKGREVVPFHTSLNYFFRRFGLVVAATVEEKAGVPPSSAAVARVTRTIQDRKVRALVTHPFYSETVTRSIGEKTGARVVTVPLEHEDAIALVDMLVREIGAALR
jgi:ABC-type Zn uptake system ZnuABC Zn-binding protein ZnuA